MIFLLTVNIPLRSELGCLPACPALFSCLETQQRWYQKNDRVPGTIHNICLIENQKRQVELSLVEPVPCDRKGLYDHHSGLFILTITLQILTHHNTMDLINHDDVSSILFRAILPIPQQTCLTLSAWDDWQVPAKNLKPSIAWLAGNISALISISKPVSKIPG